MSELDWAKLKKAIESGANLAELILDTQGVSVFVSPETKPTTSPCSELYVTTDIPDEVLQFSFMRNHLSIHEENTLEKGKPVESYPVIDVTELLSLHILPPGIETEKKRHETEERKIEIEDALELLNSIWSQLRKGQTSPKDLKSLSSFSYSDWKVLKEKSNRIKDISFRDWEIIINSTKSPTIADFIIEELLHSLIESFAKENKSSFALRSSPFGIFLHSALNYATILNCSGDQFRRKLADLKLFNCAPPYGVQAEIEIAKRYSQINRE